MSAAELEVLLHRLGIVPVVTIDDACNAAALGRALLAGGLAVAEITFRTDAAERAITLLTAEVPDLVVGAGTVLTPATVDRAVAAGARFIVAPGFNPDVVDHCLSLGVPVVPGVCTPTEVEMGLARGLSLLKFFPAETSGGTRMLKDLSAPYGNVRFMPTGGINLTNLAEYLARPEVVACGGTWIATTADIAGHRFDAIAANAHTAATAVVAARSGHDLTGSRPSQSALTTRGSA